MIGADPVAYVDWTLAQWTLSKSLAAFSPAALDSYRAQALDPARVHAMCADYRAGASFDRALDEADKAAGKQITAPLRLLYGAHGFPAKSGSAAEIWRSWAPAVEASVCESGHFVMEENPQAVLALSHPSLRPRESPSLSQKTSLYAAIAQIPCEVWSGASTGLAGRHPGLRHNP